MTKKIIPALICCCILSLSANAQLGKLKGLMGGKKDSAKTESADTAKKAGKEKAGGSFFSKAIVKLAAVAGNTMMSATGQLVTTDDLSKVTPMVYSSVNMYPATVGTAEMGFYKSWKSGGNLTTLFFTQKDKFGIAKIDGSVTINGEPAVYASTGVYTAFTANDNKPAKVDIVTKSGQKASFTVNMTKFPVTIKSINGQTGDNIPVDLTKDMVIELNSQPGSENVPLRANIVITQIGIRGFFTVANFKGTNKLTIPAAAFRNINITPGGNALYNFKNCYLSIDRIQTEKTTDVSGAFQPIEYTAGAQDGRFINVSKEPALNPGLTAKGSEKMDAGEMEYTFFKPNAFLSRPFSQIKNLGVMSFSVRGTTYVSGGTSKSSSSYSVGSTTYTTTTTTQTWAQFPTVSDQVWNGLLESLYQDFTNAAKQELAANVLPVKSITSSAAYQDIQPFTKDDETTSVSFFHSYQDTKMLSAYMPISEGYTANSANVRIMKQTGADALMKFTFDLQIAIDRGKPVMVPKLAFEMVGAKNGDTFDTKFCTANITGKGVRFPAGNITVADMQKVIRQADLLAAFKKGLKEIKDKEIANGDYKIVWDLQ